MNPIVITYLLYLVISIALTAFKSHRNRNSL